MLASERTKERVQANKVGHGGGAGGGCGSDGTEADITGEGATEVAAEDVVLPCPVLGLLRILGRLRTTLAHRSAASAERRYRSDTPPTVFFLTPPGPRAARRGILPSAKASSPHRISGINSSPASSGSGSQFGMA